jgi:hypothetical protein
MNGQKEEKALSEPYDEGVPPYPVPGETLETGLGENPEGA